MTPRKGETHEEFLARRRPADKQRYERKWQEIRRTVGPGGTSTVYVPEREEYHELDGYALARRSTLVDAEGKVINSWRIEKPEDEAKAAALQATLEAFREDGPRCPRIPCESHPANANLLTGYPIGDHHMGMLSWWRETGDSYDLDISEKLLAHAIDHLVERSEPSMYALVATLGDFLHYDSMKAVTPEHGHILDQDSRAAKMVRAAARALMRTIDRAAEKHTFVEVIVEFGNHDPYSTLWLMELLRIRYEGNPRITVNTNPGAFHYHRFGSNLIGTHHGDTVKRLDDLPLIMAADRPEDWGATKHRIWWTGHKHSHEVKSFNGCEVEQFPILAPPDAYAHMLGYHKIERRMQSIVFDRNDGEVARYSFRPEMIHE